MGRKERERVRERWGERKIDMEATGNLCIKTRTCSKNVWDFLECMCVSRAHMHW